MNVESHAMVDLEDKDARNLFPEGDSEHGHGPRGWSGGDRMEKESSIATMV